MKREIAKGVVVRYQDGNYRVTAVRGGKVNLGAIFGKAIYHKGVPIDQVVDDEAAWYARWTQSETYMCM